MLFPEFEKLAFKKPVRFRVWGEVESGNEFAAVARESSLGSDTPHIPLQFFLPLTSISGIRYQQEWLIRMQHPCPMF